MKQWKHLLILGFAASLWLAACASTGGAPEKSEESPATTSKADSPSPSKTNQAGEASLADRPVPTEREFRIITLLPQDAIPAIDHPEFYSAQEAEAEYAPSEQVIGVFIDGEARAYSTAKLSRHEIVNDTVAGRKIAVTW